MKNNAAQSRLKQVRTPSGGSAVHVVTSVVAL